MIKQAAVEAVAAQKPFSFAVGQVASISPLEIKLNQKITLPASKLMLTSAVKTYGTNNNPYTKDLSLRVGETVILLRCDGGQRYIVLDRLEAP
ncbi:MAG: DUF2577 domain-containing protein [Clostridia bacterium]|nr:DUF2577 domain-containing protein [Clostridia bacterium]